MATEALGLRERLHLALGTTYTLERELGGGGMSHVFVARDATLGRHVVVKVLPPDTATALSAERFQREIALAARLQHPHIVPLLAAGVTADGLPFYTMPLVDGESLRARLDRAGELAVGEAVSVLKDVARALAYAHARGVVHRDIKPENVLLSGGAAVVTDFGVAKALDASTTAGAHTSLTRRGVALGTPAYMAPEQAAADPAVDHRADLYAFGCVAYELLTGQPPFTGRPAPALLAAHISEAPEPIARRRPTVPGSLAALVMQCLEKRPADRPASAGEILRALDVAITPAGTPAAAPRDGTATRRVGWLSRPRLALVPAVALVLVTIAATAAVAWRLRPDDADDADDGAVVRVALTLDPDERPALDRCAAYALSPDGRRLVYLAAKPGGPTLRVRSSDRLASRTVEGAGGLRCPAVSPDGRWIAYVSGAREGEVGKIPMDGGTPVRLAEPPTLGVAAGVTWATPETIVTSDGVTLWAVPSAGGAARRLSSSDTTHGERRRLWPQALPDGQGVLYASSADTDGENGRIAVISLDGSRSTVLDLPGTYPVGVVASRLVYVDAAGALRAVPFDLRRWRVTGNPVTLIDHVEQTALGGAQVALSRNGTLTYLSGRELTQPVLLARDGTRRPLPLEPRAYANPRFSPDGTRIAFGVDEEVGSANVWIYDVVGGPLTRLTTAGNGMRPEWSPDGRRVLYIRSDAHGAMALWSQPADGSGPGSLLYASPDDVFEGVLTPDGRTLVYRTGLKRAVRDIFAVSLDGGDRTPRPLVTGPAVTMQPRVSPDGNWLAYQSRESGTMQIYVRPFPGPGGRTQVSVGGGREPLWSPDGRHLFYREFHGGLTRLVDATVRTAPVFAVLARTAFLEGDHEMGSPHQNYDVAPDGTHFLMLERAGAPQQIIVVHNWLRELLAATGER